MTLLREGTVEHCVVARIQQMYSTSLNAMTVDVEDYFQVQAFEHRICRASWEQIPRRVENNIAWLLDLFAAQKVRATFFMLGWIAERHPDMVRRIAAAGHELASHGYDHVRIDRQSPTAFRDDVHRSKDIIENIVGCPIFGYRAPTFSISSAKAWAYQVLEDEGYSYSSSIYPIRHDLYGAAGAPRRPFQPGPGKIWEFPLSTRRHLGQNLPCSGGGYFRLLPYWASRRNVRFINAVDELPVIFFMHPWEIDVAQPRISNIGLRSRIRHYTNLKTMPARLARLVGEFYWGRMDEVFANQLNSGRPQLLSTG